MSKTAEAHAPEKTTRKRRTALEVFVDQKKEHAAKVAGIEAQIVQLQADLEAAKKAQEEFIENAKKALGL